MLIELIGLLIAIWISAYAIVMIIGGMARAGRFARWSGHQLVAFISTIGSLFASLLQRYPLATGIILIALILTLLYGRHQ